MILGGPKSAGARAAMIREAHALALRAKCGERVRAEAAGLESSASAALPAGDVLLEALREFACALTSRDHQTVQAAGIDMERHVIRLIRPAPVDAHRADIHG